MDATFSKRRVIVMSAMVALASAALVPQPPLSSMAVAGGANEKGAPLAAHAAVSKGPSVPHKNHSPPPPLAPARGGPSAVSVSEEDEAPEEGELPLPEAIMMGSDDDDSALLIAPAIAEAAAAIATILEVRTTLTEEQLAHTLEAFLAAGGGGVGKASASDVATDSADLRGRRSGGRSAASAPATALRLEVNDGGESALERAGALPSSSQPPRLFSFGCRDESVHVLSSSALTYLISSSGRGEGKRGILMPVRPRGATPHLLLGGAAWSVGEDEKKEVKEDKGGAEEAAGRGLSVAEAAAAAARAIAGILAIPSARTHSAERESASSGASAAADKKGPPSQLSGETGSRQKDAEGAVDSTSTVTVRVCNIGFASAPDAAKVVSEVRTAVEERLLAAEDGDAGEAASEAEEGAKVGAAATVSHFAASAANLANLIGGSIAALLLNPLAALTAAGQGQLAPSSSTVPTSSSSSSTTSASSSAPKGGSGEQKRRSMNVLETAADMAPASPSFGASFPSSSSSSHGGGGAPIGSRISGGASSASLPSSIFGINVLCERAGPPVNGGGGAAMFAGIGLGDDEDDGYRYEDDHHNPSGGGGGSCGSGEQFEIGDTNALDQPTDGAEGKGESAKANANKEIDSASADTFAADGESPKKAAAVAGRLRPFAAAEVGAAAKAESHARGRPMGASSSAPATVGGRSASAIGGAVFAAFAAAALAVVA